MRWRTYGVGVSLFRQGDDCTGVLVLCAGWLKLVYAAEQGRMATLSLAGPGTIVGIREMLSNEPYGLSAEVLETVEAAYLQRADVLSLLRDEPQAALWMLRALSRENSGLALELCEVVTKLPSAERLLRILQELAQRAGRSAEAGTRIRLPLTVQDLADRVGCSRQWTSRMLGEIESQGLIHRERGWISVAPASR